MLAEYGLWIVAWCFFALCCGGFIKGALGVGTPLLTVPMMAQVLPPQMAIAIMAVPVVVANLWQFAQIIYQPSNDHILLVSSWKNSPSPVLRLAVWRNAEMNGHHVWKNNRLPITEDGALLPGFYLLRSHDCFPRSIYEQGCQNT